MDRHSNCVWDEEEVALLREVQAGSDAAFTQLANRYEPMLRRLSGRLATPLVPRDDLRQEGLLGLLSAAQTFSFEKQTAFSTYARVCAWRRMVSAVRRAYWRDEVLFPETEPPRDSVSEGQADLGPEQIFFQKDEDRCFHQRLRGQLTPLEYEVLCGHLDGCSYEEIAARLQIGCKSVDNALQRVRRKLSASSVSE